MRIRPAEPEDAMAVARVHVRSWQMGYRDLMPSTYLDALKPEDRARRYTFGAVDPKLPSTLVAVEDETIRGFATTAPSRDADSPSVGELCALYVDPDHWGHRLGVELIAAARLRLAAQGFTEAILWVLARNERAMRFYRADGWTSEGAIRKEQIWGLTLDELRFRRALP
jgi:GNAT superfamily N-acetyltransferase